MTGRRRTSPSRWPLLLRWSLYLFSGLLGFSLLLVVPFRWLDPPFSSVMAQQQFAMAFSGQKSFRIDYRWTDWSRISPHLALAVIASEDQKFLEHRGFDFEAIADAVEEHMDGGRMRGASTITQQVAKNLYLWQGRSFVRKGLEAYFTVLLEALWSKQRILEVYLNIAEFGVGVYGVGAASRRFFAKSPGGLTSWECYRLAAVLPSPRRMNPARPSAYVTSRARWIHRQVRLMGGLSAIRRIAS